MCFSDFRKSSQKQKWKLKTNGKHTFGLQIDVLFGENQTARSFILFLFMNDLTCSEIMLVSNLARNCLMDKFSFRILEYFCFWILLFLLSCCSLYLIFILFVVGVCDVFSICLCCCVEVFFFVVQVPERYCRMMVWPDTYIHKCIHTHTYMYIYMYIHIYIYIYMYIHIDMYMLAPLFYMLAGAIYMAP